MLLSQNIVDPQGLTPKKPIIDPPATQSPRLVDNLRCQVNESQQEREAKSVASRSLFNPDGTVASTQSQMAARVDYVCEQQIYYHKKIEAERRRLADVEKRILRAKTAIIQRRKQIAQASKDRVIVKAAARNLGKLENKLNLLLVKNNLTEKANVEAKKQIDNLRMEKIRQLQVTNRLDREHRTKKAKIASMVSEAQQLQDKKDRTQREIEVLKQKILDELDANNAAYQALKAQLSVNQMGITNEESPDSHVNKKNESKKREMMLKGLEGSMTQEEEEHIVSNINKAYWAIAKKKMDIQKQADKIHELVDDFKYLSEQVIKIITFAALAPAASRLRSLPMSIALTPLSLSPLLLSPPLPFPPLQTGVTSVETLIPILLSSEEENFRLFDVTNELNKELETLEVEKGEIRSRINHFTKVEVKQNEGKTKIKRELEDQIERAKAQASKADQKYNVDMEVIKKVAPSVTSIFNKVGCDDEGLQASLLTAGVTDRSIMAYMAVIEERIGEIVQLHNTTQKHGIISHFEGLVEDPTRPKTPQFDTKGKRVAALSQPVLPSYDDFDDGDDEEGEEDVEPMQISKLHDMVATQARASRLGGGTRSKLSIGYKGKNSNVSLRGKGSRRSLKALKHLNAT